MSIFDQELKRKGTYSVKWDMMKDVFGTDDLLPMWVADMDFLPPDAVLQSMKKRLQEPPFGYTFVPPETAKIISRWLEKRHGWKTSAAWYMYSPGVVPSIATAVRALTEKGDQVLTMTPAYPPFFSMVEQNERELVLTQLIEKNNRYEIDWDDLSEKLKHVKMFLLCSPHNPSGRIWTEDELKKISDLCNQEGVYLVSDEIHSDLVYRHAKHVPAALAGDNAPHIITFVAPSKTFNLAGMQASAIIASDEEVRKKLQEDQGKQGFFTLSTFGITAMEAAYSDGEEWLEQLIDYLEGNLEIVRRGIEDIDGLYLMEPDSTYLLWFDASEKGLSEDEMKEALYQKAKLGVDTGEKYGKGGEGFIRMNIASPRSMVEEGMARLKKAFE
ncbi:MalY/PatB family protein [Jeotgalibacillus terrae]|uniref:cysteine-S-conjugate beta-lyase n=1 Tax=Jeotgalibacillus terrae TaxID=587735 RepID=A0ABW5ZH64_9BACL|nr:PatB family C-S lyase [Jeotgalibacillus terrae]MBM7580515.1 cystathionine beta-lyase [Jeotgalibacillus terrae]